MINETANATAFNLTATSNSIMNSTLVERFIELIRAPIDNSEMLWIVVPLLITLFVMELYFGRYTKEKLSWDSATGNALALLFVTADLIRHLVQRMPDINIVTAVVDYYSQFAVIVVVAAAGFWLMLGDFFHVLPEKVAMTLSSSLPINITAYVCIAVIYTGIKVDITTFFSAIMLFVVLRAFFYVLRFFEPIIIPTEEKK